MAHIPRMDRTAKFHKPVDDFPEQSPDALDLAGSVEASHERAYKAPCCHSAQAAAFFNDQGRDAETGRGDGGAYTGRTASNDEYFRFL